VSRQQLHALIDGRAAVTPRMALRLQAAFGPAAESWLVMQMHYDLSRARKSPPRGVKSIG
jgi:addiction module HigA family antidote